MKDILLRTRAQAEEALAYHRRGKLCFWLPGERPPGEIKHPDNRTDIYCIGCTLFQALSPEGIRFQPEFYRQIGPMLASPPWRNTAPDAQKTLQVILRRCLAPRPQGRYSCCEELLADLDQVIAALRAQKPPP